MNEVEDSRSNRHASKLRCVAGSWTIEYMKLGIEEVADTRFLPKVISAQNPRDTHATLIKHMAEGTEMSRWEIVVIDDMVRYTRQTGLDTSHHPSYCSMFTL